MILNTARNERIKFCYEQGIEKNNGIYYQQKTNLHRQCLRMVS